MSFVADMDILLEEEADKQRVVEENQLAEYLAVVKQRRDEERRARAEERRIEREKHQLSEREGLAIDLADGLAIIVPVDRVRIVETGDFGEWFPAVDFGGLTFAKPFLGWSLDYLERHEIYVARPCAKCGHPIWVRTGSPTRLLDVLEEKPEHEGDCLHVVDDDVPTNRAPVVSPAERYAAAVKLRRQLQFERAREKEFAIRRIIANKGVTFNGESFVAGSATAAEKLVEFDEGFAAAYTALTEAVVAEIGARAAYIAAGGNPSKEDEES